MRRLQGQMQEAILNTVHFDLRRKNQRLCNITVTGLAPHHGCYDNNLFEEICKRDLGFQPNGLVNLKISDQS
jgi:hypothetical protein